MNTEEITINKVDSSGSNLVTLILSNKEFTLTSQSGNDENFVLNIDLSYKGFRVKDDHSSIVKMIKDFPTLCGMSGSITDRIDDCDYSDEQGFVLVSNFMSQIIWKSQSGDAFWLDTTSATVYRDEGCQDIGFINLPPLNWAVPTIGQAQNSPRGSREKTFWTSSETTHPCPDDWNEIIFTCRHKFTFNSFSRVATPQYYVMIINYHDGTTSSSLTGYSGYRCVATLR